MQQTLESLLIFSEQSINPNNLLLGKSDSELADFLLNFTAKTLDEALKNRFKRRSDFVIAQLKKASEQSSIVIDLSDTVVDELLFNEVKTATLNLDLNDLAKSYVFFKVLKVLKHTLRETFDLQAKMLEGDLSDPLNVI